MNEQAAPKMGKNAALWRRLAYRAFDNMFLRRRVRTPDGSFDAYVSPGCQLNVLDPRGVPVDPVHTRFIARWIKPDSVIWDVGGNMGLFAFPAALKARQGMVYSFEPDVDLAHHLLRAVNRPHNAGLPVSVLPLALSDGEGVAEFLIAGHGRSMNKLAGEGTWHDGLFVAREKRQVATLRMDVAAKFCRAPDMIKIDVEGAEMRVLEGGRETIAAARPVVLVEGPRELWPQLLAYFKALDYVIYDGVAEVPVLLDEPVWDTVAVPREKWA